jgi:hypothetical protein
VLRRALPHASLFGSLLAFVIAALGFAALASGQNSGKNPSAPAVTYVETPIAFEATGTHDTGSYSAKGHGYAVTLRTDGALISFPDGKKGGGENDLSLNLSGSNPQVDVSPEGVSPGVSNYIPTSDRKTWRMGVPRWKRITYRHVYAGIDLTFYGNQQLLEYDFRVHPNADPGLIQMSIAGAEDAQVDNAGNLNLRLNDGDVRFLKPVAYQLSSNGQRESVTSGYRLTHVKDAGHAWKLSFTVGPHDANRELVIDPVLSYGLQLAYTDSNIGGIVVDGAGNTFVTGQNQTKGFYVSKFNPAGTLIFNTVIAGGTVTSYPTGIVLDSSDNIYVVGSALPGLPTTSNAYQTTSPATKTSYNVPFLAELPASGGAPTYLSYLGGTNSYDYSSGIAINTSNQVVITGYESSTTFPTTPGAYLKTFPGAQYAAFVAEFNTKLSGAASLVYSTLLGATGIQSAGTSVALDASGNAYVAVQSYAGYPVTTGAFSYPGAYSDAYTTGVYLTKVNPAGSALAYSTYLGPGAITGVALDSSADAYVTGAVYAEDFPTTAGAYQSSSPGGFAAEINPGGTALLYSTFLSGPSGAYSPTSNSVFPQSIAVLPGCASSCAAYISGYTTAIDFPAIAPIQSAITPNNGGPTAFLTEIAGNGASAVFSSYLGAITGTITSPFSTPLFPTPSVSIDTAGNIYFAANVYGTDFPVTLPAGTNIPASYLAKISPAAGGLIVPYPTSVNFDAYNTSGQAIGVSSTLSGVPVPLLLRNMGSNPVAISSITFTPATEFSETDSCQMTIPAGGTCTLNLAFTPTAKGVQTATLTIASNATVTPVSIPLSGTGDALGYLQLSTSTVTFPDQALGSVSAGQTITVTNVGQTLVNLQPISLGSVRSTWGSGSDFQALSNCPAQLAPAASCTIGATFAPLATGPRAALFYLQGDGFGNATVSLYGAGIIGATPGTVSLSATVLNFNSQLINSPSPRQMVVLTNTSTAPISLYGVSIATAGQTSTSDFSISNGSCSSTSLLQINPQGSCYLSIEYTPTVAATETGTLSFKDSASTTAQTVSLTGSGLASSATLEITPGNFVFPDQPIGVPSTTSYFYVYNTGTAPVTVDRVLITGDYSLYSTTCAGAILKPNPAIGYLPYPNCNVRVTFTPTLVGTRTGTLTFVDSSGTPQQTFTLAGTGIAASGGVFFEPTSLIYPLQAVGTTSATQHLTITNPGNSPTTISNITTTGDYALVNVCTGGTYPSVLGAQRTCGVDISFTPTTASNPDKGSVVVTSSGGTATLPISGSGVAATVAVGLTPTALDFGSEVTNSQSLSLNIYFRNTGTEGVTLTSGTITGAAAVDYTVNGGSCGFYGNVLAPATSCYVQVYFAPTVSATRTASLTLVDSAGTQVISLTGLGVAAQTTVMPVPKLVAFDEVTVGTSAANNQTVTLHNYTTAAVLISSAKITAGGNAFLIPTGGDGCSGVTVPAGSYCNVTVGFSPTVAGYLTGTLTFTDSKSATYLVSLAGYSPAAAPSSYLDPMSLGFPGQVLTTVSAIQTVSLYNSGDLPMTVGTLTGTNTIVGTTTTGAFSLNGTQGGSDGCSTQVIAPRQRCQVYVAFAPTVAGAATGGITFPVTYGNGTTAQFSLALSGTGLAVKDAAELSPTAITFPDQATGAVEGLGTVPTQVVNLFNTGNLPITVGALLGSDTVIGVAATGDFSTASAYGGYDGCTNQPIAPGSYCSVTVGFSPASIGAKAGSIKFPVTYADKTTAALIVTLAGKGVANNSKVLVSPTSGQFDVQVVGTTSDSSEIQTFTLTNTGNLPVKITTATVTSNFSFVSDSCSGTTVPVSSQCSIVVAFSPTKTGVITGVLTIPDNAAGAPHTVALTGTGILATQQIVLSQASVAFGSQVVATKSAPVYVLVSNQSGATVPVNSVVLGGANPTDFVESDSCAGGSISGHSNCQIAIQFSPASGSLGARSATITESDTATGSPRVITLSGTGVALAPSVALYPASLNFGSQALNTKSAPFTFSVTNTGPATSSLTISKVVSSSGEFVISANGCQGKTLAGGTDCLVTVYFDPNAGSTQTGTITITDNAAVSTQTLNMTGVSVGIPQAKLTPTALTFASTGVGVVSAAQTITLANAGTDTLQIASFAFSGTNATDFHQTNTCGSSLAAAASCTISVTFDPLAVGSRTGTLTVTDNAGNTTGSLQTAALAGTGTGVAKIAFSPSSLTFAATNVGASSAAQTFNVGNSGTATLTFTGISVVPVGDYTQTNTCGTSLAAGAICKVSVTFSPQTAGSRPAAISFADNVAGSPQSVALSGTAVGAGAVTLSTTGVTFASQAVGTVSAAQTVTLTNSGSGSLTVASFKVTGTNYTDFTATSTNCGVALAPGAACAVGITFKPAAAGTRSGVLTFTDNAGNVAGTTQTVTLAGTGAGTPQATLSATTLAFASDPVSKPEGPESLLLTNGGNGPLAITSIAVTGVNASDFLEFDTCVPSVAAGANCEIALYFIPSAAGTRTASLVITDNANNVAGATQTVTVTGIATGAPQVKLSLTAMAFGTVKVGTESSGQSSVVTNTGNAPLTVSSVALAGTATADYSLYNTCTTLSPGSSCIVVVFFKPTAVGSRPATVNITDNANNVAGTIQPITLSGTGN